MLDSISTVFSSLNLISCRFFLLLRILLYADWTFLSRSPRFVRDLRTVPTIVTAPIFCACQGSRARSERNAQHAGQADWFCLLKVWEVLVISCRKEASFFNRWKIISIYLVSSLKTEEVCACCYFYVWSIWPNIF